LREQALPLALRQHGPLIALVVAGILLRLWFIAVSPLNPAFSSADDGDYYRRALRLATTGVYLDDFWLIRPPGATFFFAGWLRLALLLDIPEYGWRVVQLAQVALGALTALLGYDLGRRLFSRRAGLVFAAFLSLWYPFVELSSVLFTELLYTFLFTLHLWLLARYETDKRQPATGNRTTFRGLLWLFAAGLVLGASALVRSPALYALVFVWLWLFVRNLAALRATLAPALIVLVAVLLVVGPWTGRNYLVYERFIPVDTLGPINLWLDLGSPADRNSKIQTLQSLPQADRQAYAQAQLRAELDGRPWLLLKDAWPNFRHVWKAQFVEDFFVKSSFFTRPLRETWPLGIAGDAIWLVFVLAGLAALCAPAHEGWHWRLLVLAWIAYSFLTIFLFHVEPRYLLPIWFLVGLYGAWAIAAPRALLASLGRVPLAAGLALGLAAGALWLMLSYRDYPAMIGSGIARERAMQAGDQAYRDGDARAAEQHYRQALEAQPWQNDVRASLALSLAAQGRLDEAWELVGSGGPRRSNLVAAHLARELGREKTARTLFDLVEYTAGEDIQVYAREWLPTSPRQSLRLGDDLDLGYLEGFSHGEDGPGFSFRWLEGRGRLSLPLDDPLHAGSVLELRLSGGLPGTTPLTLRFADGSALRILVSAGEWRRYRVEIPPTLDGQRHLEVALAAPTFIPARSTPGSDDTRSLSLMLSDLAVE
jgi:4-amino-4-deoxy-L-arabinose transferase-like glycosyltransferase